MNPNVLITGANGDTGGAPVKESIKLGLIVLKSYFGYWYFRQSTIEELRQDLRAVSRKFRPDWDITSPSMRAARERDKKDRFYPYRKSYVSGEQE